MNRTILLKRKMSLFSAALLAMVFALATTQPNANAQTEPQPEITVPSMVSTSSDTGGMHTRADATLPSARYGSRIDLNQPTVTLDPVDVRSLSLEAEQVGINRSVEVSSNTRAQKFVNPDGSQIIVLIIKSTGASGIGVHFRNFELADGDQVYVYGPAADSIVFGPFTNKGPWGSGEFWSGTLSGDTAVIEFYTRTGESGKALEIFEISHIFAELERRQLSDQPDVLPCEPDASCYTDIEKNAVGRFLFNKNGGVFVCTGTLLSDLARDSIPYFLTANHCVGTRAVAQTVEVFWFYQTTACNSGVLRTWVQSPPGANFLATQSSNDFSLLRLNNDAPRGTVFSGWDPNAQSIGTNVVGLHHPGPFSPPSIESYLRRASGSITSTSFSCPATGLVNAYKVDWTLGATEPGSSGSGLWNSSRKLIGVLSCTSGTCAGFSSYGQFANFYSQIQRFLTAETGPPSVTTNPATNITTSSATLNGSVNPHGLTTTIHFQYGTTTSYGSTTPTQTKTGKMDQIIAANISRLNMRTTYHFRIVATNTGGTRMGDDRTFRTN
jgi:lysyl endopeptidase